MILGLREKHDYGQKDATENEDPLSSRFQALCWLSLPGRDSKRHTLRAGGKGMGLKAASPACGRLFTCMCSVPVLTSTWTRVLSPCCIDREPDGGKC